MRPCFHIEIKTPKGFLLNGLWLGPKKPKRIIVWVHGLGSSMFSKLSLCDALVDSSTAVLAFNNRGFERVAQIRKIKDKKTTRLVAGAAHEVFTDCVDDIQGAIDFARRSGVGSIYLAGHSTGCQKSIYWASKTKNAWNVKGIILLAPVSDYGAAIAHYGKKKIDTVTRVARSLVARGKPHELIPLSVWSEELDDAQRFLSLYTPESVEEIFSYSQAGKVPRTLKKVQLPILALWAEKDEFADRSAVDVAKWFTLNLKGEDTFSIIPEVEHGFKGGELLMQKSLRAFMKE